jgi:hypothetical protein
MVVRPRKSPTSKRPVPSRLVRPAVLPERSNRDFERRHGDPIVVVTETLRYSSHSRFLGRWSAP